MTSTSPTNNDSAPRQPADHDAGFRRHIAKVVLRYATQNRTVSTNEAHRQIVAETGRAQSTVKNWLTYKVTMIDLGSLARIMRRWNIPASELFPADFVGLPSTEHSEPTPTPHKSLPTVRQTDHFGGVEHLVVSLYGDPDPEALDKLLTAYTDNPRSAVLMRYPGSDMVDQIRPGEMMVVDTSCENVDGSGCYLLKFSVPGQQQNAVVRQIQPLMSEPALRLSGGSAAPSSLTETLQLNDGALPGHITVLGRILAVLRRI